MRSLLSVALILTASIGCAAGAADVVGADGGGTSSGGSSSSTEPTSLDFVAAGDELDARARVELVVQALPPRVYRVRFSLPRDESGPRDAALDVSVMETDETGRGTAILTAPSSAGSLTVRATIGSVTSRKSFSVNGPSTATLRVQPIRLGRRQATTWVATVHQGKTCADVTGVPPPDGELYAMASATDAPEVTGVRTGVPLAVTLRSDYFMGGCQTVDGLASEASSAPRTVMVSVLDRPIELGSSSLTLSLGLSELGAAWDAILTQASAEMLGALHGTGSISDIETLLDAMQAGLPPMQQTAFRSARLAESWDALASARWPSATRLSDVVGTWLNAGKAELKASDGVLVGWLEATSDSKANFQLQTVVGRPAATAGFSQDAQVTWSAGPDDTVLLSTYLYFSGSRLLAALSEPGIRATSEGALSIGAALANELDCQGIGATLAAAGVDEQTAYAGCGAECMIDSCRSASAAIWQRASDASPPTMLGVAATGQGWVGDQAQLAGMSGSWVGKLQTATGELPTGGVLTGAQPPLRLE